MTDFRAWVTFASKNKDHWLGSIARDVRATGWIGSSPESLRRFLKEQSFPTTLLLEVEQLALFFKLYNQRQAHTFGP